jgi:dTDP-4-amino-4,6-dideoxygalactose transaminase
VNKSTDRPSLFRHTAGMPLHDTPEASASPSRIPFTRATPTALAMRYLGEALESGKLGGGGSFSHRCEAWLERELGTVRALLTHSCTGALEMAALLSGVGPGDEVIMPSFTFSSTANAFALRGAVPVFVDVHPGTLNLDERQVEAVIGPRTRVVVPVHYAGLACDMDPLLDVARRHGLMVIEDAAQAHGSTYRGRPLGTLGQLGCLSFHETKNLVAGEGGALLINDPALVARAEVLQEKGTDRSRFLRGEVDKYTWRDVGSSFVPSELSAAVLLSQLEAADAIIAHRRRCFDLYARALAPLAELGLAELPPYRADRANGHIFWMLLADVAARSALVAHLRGVGIQAVSHYVPLHSSPAGRRLGRTAGALPVTDSIADRLLRLPLHAALTGPEVLRVAGAVRDHFGLRPIVAEADRAA